MAGDVTRPTDPVPRPESSLVPLRPQPQAGGRPALPLSSPCVRDADVRLVSVSGALFGVLCVQLRVRGERGHTFIRQTDPGQ